MSPLEDGQWAPEAGEGLRASVLPRTDVTDRYKPPELLWRSGQRWSWLPPAPQRDEPTETDLRERALHLRAFFTSTPTIQRSMAAAMTTP